VEELYERLARITGSMRCLEYDACPHGELVYNIDGYSEGDSRLPWMTLRDWGWKSTVASASDIAASGGEPLVILYSIGVRSIDDAIEIAGGVAEASKWINTVILKADTNKCIGDSWIDIAVIGRSSRPIPRSGAKPGEVVMQIGYSGYGLVSKLILDGKLSLDTVDKSVVDYTRRPKPPIRVGRLLGDCGVSASIDNSDGLGYSLWIMSQYSRVKISLEDPLVDPGVSTLLEEAGLTSGDVYLSWEDYNIVVSIGVDGVDCLLRECRIYNVPCSIIGRVNEGYGVYYKGSPLRTPGWTWFQ